VLAFQPKKEPDKLKFSKRLARLTLKFACFGSPCACIGEKPFRKESASSNAAAESPASACTNQSASHPDGDLVNPELDTVVPTPERRLALPISIKEEKSAITSAAGTVLSYEPAVFTVPAGGAWLNVSSFRVDDWGFLGAVPVGKTRSTRSCFAHGRTLQAFRLKSSCMSCRPMRCT